MANPTYKQLAASPLELVIAGTEDAILMVESGGREITEEQMLEALAFGHEQCQQLARIQKELVGAGGQAALGVRRQGRRGPRARGASPRAGDRQGRGGALDPREAGARPGLEAIFEEVWAAVGGRRG